MRIYSCEVHINNVTIMKILFASYRMIILLAGLESAAIAGIVVGVIVLIVLVAVITYVVMKKKKKSKSTVNHISTSGVSTIPNVGRVNPTPVTDSEKNSEAA